MKELGKTDEGGFTLIELLAVNGVTQNYYARLS